MENLSSRRVRTKMDRVILILTYMLVAIGIVMIYSASSIQARAEHGSSIYYLRSQAVYAVLGTITLILAIFIDYRIYKRFVFLLAVLNVGLLAVTLAFPPVNEARRWIRLPGITFQTSEFSKFAVIVTTAYFLSEYKEKIAKFTYLIRPILFMGVTFGLVAIQPSFSASMTIAITCVVMLFIGGMSMLHTFLLIIGGGEGALVLGMMKDYRMDRITSFLNPLADIGGKGWQIANSLFAISSGGVFGLGFGKSAQKFFYISQPQNDLIFAVIAEELGFTGSILILFTFIALLFRMFRVALETKDEFGRLLVIGIAIQLGIQLILNIGVATSLVPATGVGLPFISYGGSSILMFLFMMGVVLNVSRNRDRANMK